MCSQYPFIIKRMPDIPKALHHADLGSGLISDGFNVLCCLLCLERKSLCFCFRSGRPVYSLHVSLHLTSSHKYYLPLPDCLQDWHKKLLSTFITNRLLSLHTHIVSEDQSHNTKCTRFASGMHSLTKSWSAVFNCLTTVTVVCGHYDSRITITLKKLKFWSGSALNRHCQINNNFGENINKPVVIFATLQPSIMTC